MKNDYWVHFPGSGPAWLADCNRAISSESEFSMFRRLPALGGITENRNSGARRMWEEAIRLSPWIADYKDELCRYDKIGGPPERHVEGIGGGDMSGNTADSVLIVATLEQLFGDIKGWNVAEIGAGYGNFAVAWHILAKPASYIIYDLPEPSLLQRKYVCMCGIEPGDVKFASLGDKGRDDYDLSFSWTSLCELTDEGRDTFLEPVISRAKRGVHVGGFHTDCRSARKWFRAGVADRHTHFMGWNKTQELFPPKGLHISAAMYTWGVKPELDQQLLEMDIRDGPPLE